jgi:hypothetical protein
METRHNVEPMHWHKPALTPVRNTQPLKNNAAYTDALKEKAFVLLYQNILQRNSTIPHKSSVIRLTVVILLTLGLIVVHLMHVKI